MEAIQTLTEPKEFICQAGCKMTRESCLDRQLSHARFQKAKLNETGPLHRMFIRCAGCEHFVSDEYYWKHMKKSALNWYERHGLRKKGAGNNLKGRLAK